MGAVVRKVIEGLTGAGGAKLLSDMAQPTPKDPKVVESFTKSSEFVIGRHPAYVDMTIVNAAGELGIGASVFRFRPAYGNPGHRNNSGQQMSFS